MNPGQDLDHLSAPCRNTTMGVHQVGVLLFVCIPTMQVGALVFVSVALFRCT